MFQTLFSLLLLLAHPGGQGQAPVATNPVDECVLKGVVTSAAGGDPLRKAAVTLCLAGNAKQCTGAVTDATGQFELKIFDAGRYTLSASCTGYIEQQYGQRKLGGSGEILDLAPGHNLSGLSIRLIPAAVIYGNVYDENGAPVADVVVSELHIDYGQGQRQLRPGAVTRTNDLGEYRIWGLNPGTHFILAENNLERLGKIRSDIGYLPTFHPNVLDAAHAAPIVVQGGDQYSANIDLQPAHTAQVRGHIYDGGSNVRVFLLLRDFTAFGDLVPPVYAQVQDGDYQLNNVTPGSYYLYAMGQSTNGPAVNRQPLEVTDADQDHVDMTLRRASNLSGNIMVEGSRPPQGPFQVGLVPRNGSMIVGQAPSTWTGRFGEFAFETVYPGDYDLQVENIPEGCYLRSARMGGYDVLDRGISTDANQYGGRLTIVIGRNGATLVGTVSKDHDPYSGATVVLVPDPPQRDKTHLYMLTGTDHNGRFMMEGIAPGDYKVFAWESVEHVSYASSDFLQTFELRGESAHVREGSRVMVNLDLIPETDVAQ